MPMLDDYRLALLAALPDVSDTDLERALEAGGADFVPFVIDYGLGPLWHERTGRAEFHASRMAAEALFLAQEHALSKVDSWLEHADIDYAVIKGAATRLLAYDTPAIRACHDIDVLVQPDDRLKAASELVREGYAVKPNATNISRELVLSRGRVDIDLHWGLLREGRLRTRVTPGMLARRRRVNGIWMLDSEDTLFILLVHPAFAKHLAGWTMGLHRFADILIWVGTQEFDWPTVRRRLEENGVAAAAWATLRRLELMTGPHTPAEIVDMRADLSPGIVRRAWLDRWLQRDLAASTARARWLRLAGFSTFLHDTPADALRALSGRRRALRRQEEDMAAFGELLK